MMRRDFWWGLALVLVVSVAAHLWASGTARPPIYNMPPGLEVAEPSDMAEVISWSLAVGADTSTVANMTTATAGTKVLRNRRWIYVSAFMAGALDEVEVTPYYLDSSGVYVRAGRTQTLEVDDAKAPLAQNGFYGTDTAIWETHGEYQVILHLETTVGTLRTVWLGTN